MRTLLDGQVAGDDGDDTERFILWEHEFDRNPPHLNPRPLGDQAIHGVETSTRRNVGSNALWGLPDDTPMAS